MFEFIIFEIIYIFNFDIFDIFILRYKDFNYNYNNNNAISRNNIKNKFSIKRNKRDF